MAVEARVLHDDAARLAVDAGGGVLGAERVGGERHELGAAVRAQRLDDGTVLRVQSARHDRLAAARQPVRHQHGLRGRGRAVVHRGVGDLHAGQQRHLRLELEQALQRLG